MTKQDWEIKLEGAKKNTVLPEKQREQIIALYTRKIAEFEAADKKPEPKAPAKKESLLDYENGVIDEIVRVGEMSKAQAKKLVDTTSGVALIKKGYKEDYANVLTAREIIKLDADKQNKEYAKAVKDKDEDKITKIVTRGSKKIDYDCDELIAKAKKAKAAAKERAAAPKKTEVTKSKETIEKVHDKVQKNVEAGKFGKAQLQKLITETEDLLTFLKKTLKSL